MDLILYNPKSKNSRANIQTHRLVKKYKKAKIPFRLKSILKISDITTYLDKNTKFDKIILLGGDGTINQLVNRLIDHDLKQDIYLKKNGSGNDFLRSLKDQDKLPQTIMQTTLDDNGTHYFINGTGIGLDGLVINYVDNAKNKGKLTYFLSSFRGMMDFIPEPADVIIDGEKIHFEKVYSIMANNGRYVGGGMEMTKNANIDDEFLEVLIVHKVPKFLLLFIFSTVYLGLHTKFKRWVYTKRCKTIEATFTTPQSGQSDGERFTDVTKIKITSSKKSIHLRAY